MTIPVHSWVSAICISALPAPDGCRSRASRRTACHAAAAIASRLHPTDRDGRARAHEALSLVLREPASGLPLRGAAAAALGALAASDAPSCSSSSASIGGQQHQSSNPATALVRDALGLLLQGLASLAPSMAGTACELAAAAPPALQPLEAHALSFGSSEESDDDEDDGDSGGECGGLALRGVLDGLSSLLSAGIGAGVFPPPMASLLHRGLLQSAAALCGELLDPAGPAEPGHQKSLNLNAAHRAAAFLSCLPHTSAAAAAAANAATAAGAVSSDGKGLIELLISVAGSQAVHGVLRGAAARALGVVLSSSETPAALHRSMLLGTSTSAPPISAGPPSLDLLCLLAGEGGTGTMGASHLRIGALAGLSALLLGPASPLAAMQRGGGLPSPVDGGLLAAPEAAKSSRRLIKILEAAAMGEGGGHGRVAAAAAWMLGVACEQVTSSSLAASVAGQAGDGSASRSPAWGKAGDAGPSSSRPISLSAYPAETGAHRPLVDLVMATAASQGPVSRGVAEAAAAALRCLAASPRLPATDWGSLCTRLWRRPAAASGDVGAFPPPHDDEAALSGLPELHEAIVGLAVSHGSESDHGLSTFLDGLVTGGGLQHVHPRVMAALLLRLPELLSCLASSRHPAALAALLPALQQQQQRQGGGGRSDSFLLLLGALWHGLAGLQQTKVGAAGGGTKTAPRATGTSPPPHPVVFDAPAVYAVMVGALGLLPPLPPLLPGEVAAAKAMLLQLEMLPPQAWSLSTPPDLPGGRGLLSTLASPTGGPVSSSSSGGSLLVLRVWCQAARCLSEAGSDVAVQLLTPPVSDKTGVEGPIPLGLLQMRCLLALAGVLTYRDLTVCRQVEAESMCEEV